jgi:hypothetical protein
MDMHSPGRVGTRGRISVVVLVAALVVTGAATWVATSGGSDEEGSMANDRGAVALSDVATSDLAVAAQTKIFFGHQSVGMNILDGVRDVYAAHNAAVPKIDQSVAPPSGDAGVIEHDFIGENGKPLLKIQDFDAKLRSGLGQSIDTAMLKFCYIDINSGTDVDALFAAYRTTLADLQRDFPNVAFVHVTVPLETNQGWLSKLKRWVTGDSKSNAADNAARERLNALIRKEYAGGHLLDLAAVESTRPDGARSGGTYDGQPYYSLYEGYSSDSGHLNGEGAKIAGAAWLKAVAQAAAK